MKTNRAIKEANRIAALSLSALRRYARRKVEESTIESHTGEEETVMTDWAEQKARDIFVQLDSTEQDLVENPERYISAYADALRQAHARGRAEGIEDAARGCLSLRDGVGSPYDVIGDCRWIADEIRKLK